MCGGQRTFVNYILKMHTSSVVVVENGEKEPEWNSNSSVDSKFKANIAKRWWKGRLCLVFGGTTTIIGLVIAVLGLLNDMDALPKSDENPPVPATSARMSLTNTILPAPTTSSPSNVADTNISPTIQVEVLLEMLSKMQSKEGSPTTITTKSTTTTTTTTETTTTTTTTTTITPTTTTTILPGCSCNGFIDTDDG